MNRLHKILIILTSVLLLGNCSKSPKCWGDDKNKGIIKNSVNIDLSCLPAPYTDSGEYLITSDSIYHQLFKGACTLPTIDFNSYTLLGLYAGGGCETKYIREVTEDSGQNKYHYQVTVKECGSCKSERIDYNFVLVPKLPNDWTVTFDTDYK